MDKMREEFEVWFNREKLGGITNESMVMVIKECMYEGWQASRQALVVQLPVEIDATHEDCQHSEYAYLAGSVKSALDNAGIKWTE